MLRFNIKMLFVFALSALTLIAPVRVNATTAVSSIFQIEQVASSVGSIVNIPQYGLFAGSIDGKVYRSTDGVTLAQIANLGTGKIWMHSDSQGNVYASVDTTGALYRSNDGGQSWQLCVTFPDGGILQFDQLLDLTNGTLVAALYAAKTPWLYRSDNWGTSFYLWVNFTTAIPKYGIMAGNELIWKHTHMIFYNKLEQKFVVTLGDAMPRLITSIDGRAWTEEWWTPPISAILLEDKGTILYGDDYLSAGILRYNISSKKYDYTWFGYSAGFGTGVVSDFAYKNGIVYAVGRNDTAAVRRHYVLASPDYGESWQLLFQTSDGVYYFPEVEVFGDYIYVVLAHRLYRFKALSFVNELVYLMDSGESGRSTLYNNTVTHLSFSNRIVKNPVLRIEPRNLSLNIAPNPSLEMWTGGVPKGWTVHEATGGSVVKTGGLYGANAVAIVKNGVGDYKLRTGFITTSARKYLVGAYVKTNSTEYSPDLRPIFRVDFYNQTASLAAVTYGYRTADYAVNQWRRIWWVIEAPNTVTNIAKIIFFFGAYSFSSAFAEIDFDTVFCIPLDNNKVDAFNALTALAEVPATASTSDGTLMVNDEEVPFTVNQLPLEKTLSQIYLAGDVKLQLKGGITATVDISGEEVLTLDNSIIERKINSLYTGRWYEGFKIVNNKEDALIVLADTASSITDASLINHCLNIVLDAPKGVRTYIKVYSPQKPVVVAAYGIILSPNVEWNWDSVSKILSITTIPVKDQMPLVVYYTLPVVASASMEKAHISEDENATVILTIKSNYEFPASIMALVKNSTTGELVGRMDFSPLVNVEQYDYSFVLNGYKIGDYDIALAVTDRVNNITILSTTLGFTVTSAKEPISEPPVPYSDDWRGASPRPEAKEPISEPPVPYWLIAIAIITVIGTAYFYKRRH